MLAYNDRGNGYPIVLIHGFCEDKTIWKYCEEGLAKSYRVLSIDLPGFGESRLEESEVSMEFFAEKINEFLEGLKIDKCILIGHSLGGYVGLAFAEKYEIKLDGLGLFHSTAFEDAEDKKDNRLKAIEFIQKHGVKQFAESFVPPLFSLKNRDLYKEEIAELVKVASASSEIGVVETTKAMRVRKERIQVLKRVEVPVLFMVGKLDGAVPLEKSLEQCYLPKHSIVHFLEGVGHMGMIENKALTESILVHFANLCLSITSKSGY